MKTSVRVLRKAALPWDDHYGNFYLKSLWTSGYLVPLWRSRLERGGTEYFIHRAFEDTEYLPIYNFEGRIKYSNISTVMTIGRIKDKTDGMISRDDECSQQDKMAQ